MPDVVYAAQDIPVMPLDIFGKGDKASLTKAEKNALALGAEAHPTGRI